MQPTLSPDGERMAFRSEREGGGLFVMGATGESVRRVTSQGFYPAWSPDGTRLVYATEPVFDPYSRQGRSELWTVEIVSGAARRLFEGDAVRPPWSRDGKRIAYWVNAGGQRDVWTIGTDGGAPVAVTHDEATDWFPMRALGRCVMGVRLPDTGGADERLLGECTFDHTPAGRSR